MKQALQNLLAEGKTAELIAQLKPLTASDKDLHAQVLHTSARFAEYERQKHANTEGYDPLSIEHNKINAAVLHLIEQLPDDIVAVNSPNVANTPSVLERHKWLKIGAVLIAAIGLIASIAQISGYSLKDFFSKEDKKESVAPPVEPKKIDTLVVKTPQKTVEKAISNPSSVKNQSNITVEKGGKVGAIITGDSNKIDLKQDF